MTTITMTMQQLSRVWSTCCNCKNPHFTCTTNICPIWRRAEKRLEKEMKKYNIIQPWYRKAKPMVFGPANVVGGGVVNVGRSGTPLVKDGKIVRLRWRKCGIVGTQYGI